MAATVERRALSGNIPFAIDLVEGREKVVAAGPLRKVFGEFGLRVQVTRRPENLVQQVARVTVRKRNSDVFGKVPDQEFQDFLLHRQAAYLLRFAAENLHELI